MGNTKRRPSALLVGQSVGALVDEIARRIGDGAELDEPEREARDLVAAVLDVPRHWPLMHENKWVESDRWRRARAAADKRAAGAPLAYAVGRANFRHLTLAVDERVLIPRPETELLVDRVLERIKAGGGVVVDVGTGSGAIAIALATEGPFARVIGIDISGDALDVARANAKSYSLANVEFRQGDLLRPLVGGGVGGGGGGGGLGGSVGGKVRAIVSNPPYVSYSEVAELPASVRNWEPMVALLSGDDGLAMTARLVRQSAARLEHGGLLALEVDARRAALVAELASRDARYNEVSVHLDLAGRERFVLARRR